MYNIPPLISMLVFFYNICTGFNADDEDYDDTLSKTVFLLSATAIDAFTIFSVIRTREWTLNISLLGQLGMIVVVIHFAPSPAIVLRIITILFLFQLCYMRRHLIPDRDLIAIALARVY
jgi:hypothetical protein